MLLETVTLDGKPLEGASVTFMSTEGSRVASGTTDASGNFTLKTVIGQSDGRWCRPGSHKLALPRRNLPARRRNVKEGETDKRWLHVWLARR